jgi:hypothetical protein
MRIHIHIHIHIHMHMHMHMHIRIRIRKEKHLQLCSWRLRSRIIDKSTTGRSLSLLLPVPRWCIAAR